MKTKADILSAIAEQLTIEFDDADNPRLKLYFLMEATIKVLEDNCELKGDFLLIDGNQTMSQLLTKN